MLCWLCQLLGLRAEKERTWGLGSGRSLTKRAIPFRAKQNEWAGTSGLVSEPIGQTTTTSLIRLVLAAYPGMKWDGIERTRSASAIDRIGFLGVISL